VVALPSTRPHMSLIRVWSKYSADMKTPQITALFAFGTTRISAGPHQISTTNIRYKAHDLHAGDELTT